ncbi:MULTISPECIES: hypothetical protein [unclassified Mesorhizobium]|uniref:hypothetical protein n=1 Tax=unclassified Mesorhizobium TaxID=325217 RepID=UPI00115EEB74|nr:MULTISPECIES: hypothetical protein [unclassified Mesorhizobium]TRC95631.1 hypothetical protein FJV82_27725 [Mesorhizobium sp. WSM4305]
MGLAEGFARDGIGASLLGFEIFVRWTSSRERVRFDLSGMTRFGEYATDGELVTVWLRRWRISG